MLILKLTRIYPLVPLFMQMQININVLLVRLIDVQLYAAKRLI